MVQSFTDFHTSKINTIATPEPSAIYTFNQIHLQPSTPSAIYTSNQLHLHCTGTFSHLHLQPSTPSATYTVTLPCLQTPTKRPFSRPQWPKPSQHLVNKYHAQAYFKMVIFISPFRYLLIFPGPQMQLSTNYRGTYAKFLCALISNFFLRSEHYYGRYDFPTLAQNTPWWPPWPVDHIRGSGTIVFFYL